ncbi:MAG: DUF523 domain-containing protein [Fusobacteria bacterium]|nr:DUF523 domain-containing protein [Fusobacteriota bacterium]
MDKILCSACLLGISCRFDGKSKLNEKITALAHTHILIPICPEQLSGLPTPRPPSEILKKEVFNISGDNLSLSFEKGAEEVLKIAKLLNSKTAILKSRSPSCGKGEIYDGTFSSTVILGNGITAQKLLDNGILVYCEEEIGSLL